MGMGLRQTQRQRSRLGMGLRTFAGRQRGGTQPARQCRSSKRGGEGKEMPSASWKSVEKSVRTSVRVSKGERERERE